jgi:hypothetical protein
MTEIIKITKKILFIVSALMPFPPTIKKYLDYPVTHFSFRFNKSPLGKKGYNHVISWSKMDANANRLFKTIYYPSIK